MGAKITQQFSNFNYIKYLTQNGENYINLNLQGYNKINLKSKVILGDVQQYRHSCV